MNYFACVCVLMWYARIFDIILYMCFYSFSLSIFLSCMLCVFTHDTQWCGHVTRVMFISAWFSFLFYRRYVWCFYIGCHAFCGWVGRLLAKKRRNLIKRHSNYRVWSSKNGNSRNTHTSKHYRHTHKPHTHTNTQLHNASSAFQIATHTHTNHQFMFALIWNKRQHHLKKKMTLLLFIAIIIYLCIRLLSVVHQSRY